MIMDIGKSHVQFVPEKQKKETKLKKIPIGLFQIAIE